MTEITTHEPEHRVEITIDIIRVFICSINKY